MSDSNSKISTFFSKTLGAPLINSRWSWGATNDRTGALFLRVWSDDRRIIDGIDRVRILGLDWKGSSLGYDERVRHVDSMRTGTVTYGVLCVAQDLGSTGPRRIAEFDRHNLLVLSGLLEGERSVDAIIRGTIAVADTNRRAGIPKGITEVDVRDALARLDAGAVHPFGISTGWDILHNGKRYPQKAVLGLAAERTAGRALGPYDFNAGECRRTLIKLGFQPLPKADVSEERDDEGDSAETTIWQRTDIDETEKEQLVKARRGQGVFKSNLNTIEKRCRITGVNDLAHLRASHIKPWCRSTDKERLDGNNGLLLSPHIDHLFDRGFISFTDAGDLLIADSLKKRILSMWGIPPMLNVGEFRPEQARYLSYHRREIFLGNSY